MKEKILVVDDSEVDRTFLIRSLERLGYKVFSAVNGAVGLETVKSAQPDMVILDCDMPVMGGLEMCRRLKENNETCDIPVIFLTGVDTPQNTLECFEADAENYLSKPVSPKVLASQIEVILKERSSR